MNNCKLVLGNWWLLVGLNILKSQKLLIWSCLSMLRENRRRIPLMIREKNLILVLSLLLFFQLQWICSCIKIMKFSSFSSVLNFHCMSTQMVPRANNDPYINNFFQNHFTLHLSISATEISQCTGIIKKNLLSIFFFR